MKTRITVFILLLLWSSGLYAQGAGWALRFVNTDGDFVDCGSTFLPTNGLTIEMWVSPDDENFFLGGGAGVLISDGNETSEGVDISFVGYSGMLQAIKCVANTAGGLETVYSDTELSPENWGHVAVTFNGTSIYIYINGVEAGSATFSNTTLVSTSNNLLIGKRPAGTVKPLSGDIDEVRIWNVALDQTTINNWKNVPVTASHPNWANMLAYYQFNEGSGTTTSDSKSLQSDASISGAAWFVNGDLSLPVEMALFEASPVKDGKAVELQWITASETDNLGFEILRRQGVGTEWQTIDSYTYNSELIGQGTVSHTTQYTYTDETVDSENAYQYCIVNVAVNGDKEYSQVVDVALASVIETHQLYPAYPNPFNPETNITFDIAQDGNVSLQVFDIQGRLIKTLLNNSLFAGRHKIKWDGKTSNGNTAASGVYLIKLKTSDYSKYIKVSLLK